MVEETGDPGEHVELNADQDVPRGQPWTVGVVFGYSALLAVAYFSLQLVGAALAMAVRVTMDPDADLDALATAVAHDGLALSLATVLPALLCVPLAGRLVSRREVRPWEFLGFRPVLRRVLVKSVLVGVAFVVASDGLTILLGRDIVVPFMRTAYETVGRPEILAFAVIVAAPILEEVLFRGFLLSTLSAIGAPPRASIALSSLLWAIIHVQYDLYGVMTILVLGFFLGWIRLRTGSTLPCIVVHALVNTIAFAETAMVA